MKCIDDTNTKCPTRYFYYDDNEAKKDKLTRCIKECTKYHLYNNNENIKVCMTDETNNKIITTCNVTYPYLTAENSNECTDECTIYPNDNADNKYCSTTCAYYITGSDNDIKK